MKLDLQMILWRIIIDKLRNETIYDVANEHEHETREMIESTAKRN